MEYLKIGYVQKTHGLKGELKILPLTNDINRYKYLTYIYLFFKGKYIKEEIESIRGISKDSIIIKLKNIDDILNAEKYKATYIFIDKKSGENLDEDEYYTQDIENCEVWYNDEFIGKVRNIQNLGSCDLISFDYKNREIFYPLLKKYIDSIDIKNKIIKINQFEGFLD